MPDRPPIPDPAGLGDVFGQVDVYVFDMLLRGRLHRGLRILDAGCGHGRNLHYLLAAGFDVWAVDRDPDAVQAVRSLSRRLAPERPPDRDRVASLDALPWDTGSFDAVLCSAVLHFAESMEHFRRMVDELWRCVSDGGFLWARIASGVGLEEGVVPVDAHRSRLPDGSTRFLVDPALLEAERARLGAELLDPLKTTVVHGRRSMATWVLRKPPGGELEGRSAR